MVRVIDISSGTPCVNLQWQGAEKIIAASNDAIKVPGSRRVKTTVISREPKTKIAEATIGNITGDCPMAPGTDTTDMDIGNTAADIRPSLSPI